MKRNIGMTTNADHAKENILRFLASGADMNQPTRKSAIGYAAFPGYSFNAPQGAAFSVAALVREMRTGRRAIIEPSVSDPRCWDIVFDDGTATPFSIAIDKRQLDRTLTTGRGVLTVWVPTGKTLELPLEICV